MGNQLWTVALESKNSQNINNNNNNNKKKTTKKQKKRPHLLFLEGQTHQYQSVYFHCLHTFFAKYISERDILLK